MTECEMAQATPRKGEAFLTKALLAILPKTAASLLANV
jgi:hypothetical protein